MQKDADVLKMIEESGLERIADRIRKAALLSNRMIASPVDAASVPIGGSRIGGRPDLPREAQWPTHQGEPLSFIAQVRLEEVLWKPEGLPEKGLLSFFYNAADQPWGYDPEEAGQWRVLYHAEADRLERRLVPDGLKPVVEFDASAVDFSVQTTLPDWNALVFRQMGFAENETERYIALTEQVAEHNAPAYPVHRLLGNPDQVQGEMQLKCQLVAHGIDCGDPSGYQDPRRAELEPGAAGWMLLLQIDSEDETEMIWGDFGSIYFWIHEEDLRKRDFEKMWVILQCG